MKSSFGDRIFDICIYVFCIVALLLVAYPLFFIIIASFSSPADVANGSVWILPKNITFAGYKEIFSDERIWQGYRNTILYAGLGTLVNLLFTVPAAYALSRKDFMPRNAVLLFFVFTMFFGGGLIPTYYLINTVLHMREPIIVMTIPFAVNVFNMIITKTFFEQNVPDELLDASKIDGCSNFRFFWNVVLSISKPIIAVIALYYLVGHWNDYFRALIYIKGDNWRSLPLILRDILVQNDTGQVTGGDAGQQLAMLIKYGVVIVSTLPILIVYPFIQRYFTKGVLLGSVKG